MGQEQFSNDVRVRWDSTNHRDMVLLNDIIFTDSNNRKWTALAGSIINGASIPKFLWSIYGSPYIGPYRRSSVIHDVYYTTKIRPRNEVDLMFLEAMIADGMNAKKAQVFYNAVKVFGGSKW